ncbi:hypothetical protein D3C81_1418080 [compost metagenome]
MIMGQPWGEGRREALARRASLSSSVRSVVCTNSRWACAAARARSGSPANTASIISRCWLDRGENVVADV